MASQSANLQHNAAFALYGLADNEDNIAAIVREGGVQTLQACEQLVQVRSYYVLHLTLRLQSQITTAQTFVPPSVVAPTED